ncbi:MAG: class I SAM-dependent methyltransferase [Variibacter sp.]
MNPGDSFFKDGAAYERLMGRWSQLAGEAFLDWIAVPNGLRWLDIGCGTGVFTEELIKHGSPASVVALDPSAEQVAFARNRPGATMAEFQVGDAQALSLADNAFDIAAMALVIHFLTDPAKALAEAARVVRPGGWVVSYVWDYSIGGSPTAPVVAALRSLGFESSGPPSAKATSLSALQDLWRSAGLSDIETHVIPIAVEFAGFDEFWHAMTAPVGPAGKAIAAMAADTRERLRAILKERLSLPANGGRVTYQACANAIKGRKY